MNRQRGGSVKDGGNGCKPGPALSLGEAMMAGSRDPGEFWTLRPGAADRLEVGALAGVLERLPAPPFVDRRALFAALLREVYAVAGKAAEERLRSRR